MNILRKAIGLLLVISLCFCGFSAYAAGGIYTAALMPEAETVNSGAEAAVALKIHGAAYNQVDAKLTYDSDLFTFVKAEGAIVEDLGGTVSVALYGEENQADTAVTVLTFRAKAVTKDTEGAFVLTSVRAGSGEDAMTGNAAEVSAKTHAVVTVKAAYSRFDTNRDGRVDLLDVTHAQRFYGYWDPIADINGDTEVDLLDLILILNNFSEPF